MELNISQIELKKQDYVKLKKSDHFDEHVWDEIKDIIKVYQDNREFIDSSSNSVVVDWVAFLSVLGDIKAIKNLHNFKITTTPGAEQKISDHINNYKFLNSDEIKIKLKDEDIKKLTKLGFSKNITLYSYQIRDLKNLLSWGNGANFSVQGSGKTAVSLAMHLLLRNNEKIKINSLLVVSPKNAFISWDDEFNYCLDDSSKLKNEGLTELTGSYETVKKKLNSGKRNFIINYEKLLTMDNLIANFVHKNRVHLILDESHKIKNETSQRSRQVLNLAFRLPIVRKDILTGTPAPNRVEDINSQYQFLYPGPEFSGRRFWVRTTKDELDLPKPKIIPVNVEMSKPQLALYSMVIKPLLRKLATSSAITFTNYKEIRKSFIKLIQICSNPILVTRRQRERGDIIFDDNIDANLHRELVNEEKNGGSSKIRKACIMARELAEQGKKTIIWSYFVWNIEFIGKYLLRDLNAEYIHGGVQIGHEDEIGTRKNKLRRFKDKKSDCMVLVANYASCAEGISLHHACHNAIYLDRSFQADLYMQSVDRICRLGNNDKKNIYILQNKIPKSLGKNIELTVNLALQSKVDAMGRFLNDPDLIHMSESESKGEEPIDDDIQINDLQEIVNFFLSQE